MSESNQPAYSRSEGFNSSTGATLQTGYYTSETLPPRNSTAKHSYNRRVIHVHRSEVGFHRSIVQELIRPTLRQDVISRIEVQNNIVHNLRTIPDYEKHYMVPAEELEEIRRKHCSDLYRRIVPTFDIEHLLSNTNSRLVFSNGIASVYSVGHHIGNFLKLAMEVPQPRDIVMGALVDPSSWALWNSCIETGGIKLKILSENALVVYQKHRSPSCDFLYLRHLFRRDGVLHIVEKSIEHAHFPPYRHVVRGDMRLGLWTFEETSLGGTRVSYTVDMDFRQNMVYPRSIEPVIDYLLAITGVVGYLAQNWSGISNIIGGYLDVNWNMIERTASQLDDSSLQCRRSEEQTFVKRFEHFKTESPKIHQLQINSAHLFPSASIAQLNNRKLDETTPRYAKHSHHPNGSMQPVDPNSGFNTEKTLALQVPAYSTRNLPYQPNTYKQNKQNKQKDLRPTVGTQYNLSLASSNNNAGGLPEQKPSSASKVISSSRFKDQRAIQDSEHFSFKEIPVVLDSTGLVVLPQNYLKKRHQVLPLKSNGRLSRNSNWKNYFLKDQWEVLPSGSLKCINQQMMDEQHKVLGFIMSKLAKNLLSGSSILNMSLPVSIFSTMSVLQWLAQAYGFSPKYVGKAAFDTDPLTRFKLTLISGIANCLITIDVEKPFNPILGETYQGWLDGCPVYCEQISHHPPISFMYLAARGFTIHAKNEVIMDFGINSARMSADGEGVCTFDLFPNHPICYRLMSAEMSGISFGDRQIMFVGKSNALLNLAYFYEQTDGYFIQLTYNPYRKGFLSFGKQSHPDDWIEGNIVRTSSEFIAKFRKLPANKREGPSKKDIIEHLGVVSGRWTESIKIDGVEWFNPNREHPAELVDEPYPLSSNSNYREDIVYRRRKDIERSQLEKERLEVRQREDQKLREKHRKP